VCGAAARVLAASDWKSSQRQFTPQSIKSSTCSVSQLALDHLTKSIGFERKCLCVMDDAQYLPVAYLSLHRTDHAKFSVDLAIEANAEFDLGRDQVNSILGVNDGTISNHHLRLSHWFMFVYYPVTVHVSLKQRLMEVIQHASFNKATRPSCSTKATLFTFPAMSPSHMKQYLKSRNSSSAWEVLHKPRPNSSTSSTLSRLERWVLAVSRVSFLPST
jgi:hypothetical protein